MLEFYLIIRGWIDFNLAIEEMKRIGGVSVRCLLVLRTHFIYTHYSVIYIYTERVNSDYLIK